MPVQWRTYKSMLVGPQFLRVPPARIIWFMSAPHQHAIVDLHFLPNGQGSVPCLGKECHHCHLAREVHAYTVLLWTVSYSHANWTPAILDLGRPENELAQLDLRGKCLQIERRGKSDKRTSLRIAKEIEIPDASRPQIVTHRDVKPYLLARWNMQQTEEYYAPRDDAPQGRLDFKTGQSEE